MTVPFKALDLDCDPSEHAVHQAAAMGLLEIAAERDDGALLLPEMGDLVGAKCRLRAIGQRLPDSPDAAGSRFDITHESPRT